MAGSIQLGGAHIGLADNGDGTYALKVRSALTVKEVDGSPSASGVSTIKVPNGLLTDNGDGSVTLASPADVGFANPMTTAGDLILGGTAGAAGRLAKGSDSQVLTVSASTHLPVWATPASLSSLSGSGGTVNAADSTGVKATVAANKTFSVRSTDLVNNTPGDDTLGQIFQVVSLNSQGDSVARVAMAVDEYEGRVYFLNGFDVRLSGDGSANLQFRDNGGVIDAHGGGIMGGFAATSTDFHITGPGSSGIHLTNANTIILNGVPTSDPHVVGALYTTAGALMISAG